MATSLAYVRVYGKATHNYYTLYFQYWDRAKTPELAREFKMKRPELFAAGCRGYRSYTDEPVRSQYPDDPDLPPQPCFTHPDTAGHFAGVAAIYFNGRNVSGGWWNSRGRISPDKCLTPRISGKPFFYPIELANSNLFCKCQDCVRLFPHLKGDLKTSHQKFFFISKIAVAAAKIKADIGISTLAYIQTQPYPEEVKLPDNVSIQICLTHFAWWHPGIRKAQEKEYELRMKNELKKCPITLWTYLYTPHWDARRHYHYNNFPGLYPWKAGGMMKKFTSDGIKGRFSEVELQHALAEAYVSARIAFDPSLDVDTVIDQWFRAAYGKAAPAMKKIYRICEDALWNPENYPVEWFADLTKPLGPRGPHNPYWGTALHSEEVNWKIGYGERFERIETLLDQAKKKLETVFGKGQFSAFC